MRTTATDRRQQTRPHPLILERRRRERREARGWFIAKIVEIAEDLAYYHNERPVRNNRERFARRAGLAACGFFLASGVYGANQLRHEDHGGFQIEATPYPVAVSITENEGIFQDDHDPTLYAPLDIQQAGSQLTQHAASSFNTLSALSLGGIGLGTLAGAGSIERRYRHKRQTTPIAEIAASQVVTLGSMFEHSSPTSPAVVPVTPEPYTLHISASRPIAYPA